MDFNKSIFENTRNHQILCAHRGLSSANIPCNTIAAFKAALMEKAEMIELDVSISKDGKYYVFHPGMEPPHLGIKKRLNKYKSSDIEKMRFLNQDDCKTELGINTLEDVFALLKDKCYINVDKYWTDIPGITECIRKCGVEKQVIVKTKITDEYISQILKYAPDLMFMPIVSKEDKITDELTAKGINCIGAEVLFEKESDPVASDKYIDEMHDKGKVLFANAIVYNYKDVLAAGHSDDNSIIISPEYGWGWLLDKGFDIIQTDWCGSLKRYMETR